MKLKEVWNRTSALTRTAMIISWICVIASIVNLIYHSDTFTLIIDEGLVFALILLFLAAFRGEAKANKEHEICENRRRALMFMHIRVQTRLLDAEKESWTPLEIQSIFLDERERYLKEIEDE